MGLLRQVRQAGRGRREPTDWYTLALGFVILAGLPIQALIGLAGRSVAPAGSGHPGALLLGVGALAAALLLVVLMTIGPVRASAAEYGWVLSGPVDRRAELATRWASGLAGAGLLLSALAAAGAVAGRAGPTTLLLVSATGLAVGVALAAAATGLQSGPPQRHRGVRVAAVALGVVLLAGAVVLTRTGTLLTVPAGLAVGTAVTAGVLAVLTLVWGWSALPRLDRIALTASNGLAAAGGAALLFLDPALLGDVLAQRQWSQTRIRRSRMLPTGRARALLAAELVRAGRNRRAALVFVIALLGPYAAAPVVPPSWVPVITLLCAVPAVSPYGSGLRLISGSPGLRRALGGTDAQLRTVHLALPAAMVLLFTAAAAAAVTPVNWTALALVPIGVLVNLELRATAKPADFGLQVADLGFGPMPVGLVPFLVRGIAPLAIAITLQLRV